MKAVEIATGIGRAIAIIVFGLVLGLVFLTAPHAAPPRGSDHGLASR